MWISFIYSGLNELADFYVIGPNSQNKLLIMIIQLTSKIVE